MAIGRSDQYITEIILALQDHLSAEGQRAASTINKLDKETDELSQGFDQVSKKTDSFGQKLKSLGINALALNEIRHLLFALAAPVRQIGEYSDQWREMSARVNLFSDSLSQGEVAMDRLVQIALESRTPLEGVAALYARLSQGLSEQNIQQEELLEMVQALSDALLISGASASEAQGAIWQFSQAMASGTLRGEEFNSVAEQAPLLLDAMAQEMGVMKGELRALAADGQITTDVVRRAMAGMKDEWREAAETIPVTIGRAMTNLQSAMIEYVGTSEGVQAATGAIADGTQGLAENFHEIADAVNSIVGVGALALLVHGFRQGTTAIANYADQQRKAIDATVASTLETRKASVVVRTAAAAEVRAARERVVAANQTLRAQANMYQSMVRGNGLTKEAAVLGQQLAKSRGTLTAATKGLAAAEAQYGKTMVAANAASAQMLVTGSRSSVMLGKVASGLRAVGSAASFVGWGIALEQVLSIAENIKEIIRLEEQSQALTEQTAKKWGDVAAEAHGLAQTYKEFSDQRIRSELELLDLSQSQLQQYQTGLESARDYWNSVYILAQQAGEATKAAAAYEQAERYNAALRAQAGYIAQLIDNNTKLAPTAVAMRDLYDQLSRKLDETGQNANTAAESVGKIGNSLQLDSESEAMVSVAAFSQAMRYLSSDVADADGYIKLTTQDIAEGLAGALQKVSEQELLNFAQQWRMTMETLSGQDLRNAATVLDSVLGVALQKLGVDLENIRTGTTAAGRDFITAFEAAAQSAQGSTEIINAAWDGLMLKLSDTDDIDLARRAIIELGDKGVLSIDQVTRALRELDEKLNGMAAKTDEVAEAFERLGVKSTAELEAMARRALADFQTIRDAGTSSAQDVESAWSVYAERALQSGNDLLMLEAEKQAIALGIVDIKSTEVDVEKRLLAYAEQVKKEHEQNADANAEAATQKERERVAEEGITLALLRRPSPSPPSPSPGGGDYTPLYPSPITTPTPLVTPNPGNTAGDRGYQSPLGLFSYSSLASRFKPGEENKIIEEIRGFTESGPALAAPSWVLNDYIEGVQKIWKEQGLYDKDESKSSASATPSAARQSETITVNFPQTGQSLSISGASRSEIEKLLSAIDAEMATSISS
jgi:tape measure domain-containing protein